MSIMSKADSLDFVKYPHGGNLRYCPEFQNDRDVVKLAMMSDVSVLHMASDELRKDHDLIRYGLELIRKNNSKDAINYTSRFAFVSNLSIDVLSDREFMLKIIPEIGSASDLSKLSVRYLDDKEVLQAILQRNGGQELIEYREAIYDDKFQDERGHRYLRELYRFSLYRFFQIEDDLNHPQSGSPTMTNTEMGAFIDVKEWQLEPDFYLEQFKKGEASGVIDCQQHKEVMEYILSKTPADMWLDIHSRHSDIEDILSKHRIKHIIKKEGRSSTKTKKPRRIGILH